MKVGIEKLALVGTTKLLYPARTRPKRQVLDRRRERQLTPGLVTAPTRRPSGEAQPRIRAARIEEPLSHWPTCEGELQRPWLRRPGFQKRLFESGQLRGLVVHGVAIVPVTVENMLVHRVALLSVQLPSESLG